MHQNEKTDRHINRLRKRQDQNRMIYKLLKEHADDILSSQNFRKTKNDIQHGTIPVYRHCMEVAKYSILLSRFLKIPCNERELVRGALLHDYFLYDWHDKNRENYQFFHGFYHPGIALKNAKKEYELTDREKDIIKKHMWPLTVVPPTCREAWIVTAADKYCSTLETLRLRKGGRRAKVKISG